MWILSSDEDVTHNSPESSKERELIGLVLSLKTFEGLKVEIRDRERLSGGCRAASSS